MTTEAMFPEQRVTTIEEWLTKLDARNRAAEEKRVFDMLREELFSLKTVVIPDLVRQLANFDYPATMNDSEGWIGAATIMVSAQYSSSNGYRTKIEFDTISIKREIIDNISIYFGIDKR